MSLHVLGGTYTEYTSVPHALDLRGSGLRAALALVSRGATTLHTAIDTPHRNDAELIANAAGLALRASDRDGEIRFEYLTPLSPPTITGAGAPADALVAEADNMLVFGMMETLDRKVTAELLVFDPQMPSRRGSLDLSGLNWRQLHLLLNAREARGATGRADPEEAARRLLEDHPEAQAVVVKLAARGALVMRRGEAPVLVNPAPSTTVAALGTGDLFAAGYLAASADGANPVEAARYASAAVGHISETSSMHLPIEIGTLPAALPWAPMPMPTVYLASPFFTLSELWMVHFVRDILRHQGVRVFSPLHDVGRGQDIAMEDLEGLDASQAVLALTDHSDAGTLFEVGYATARGIPVIAHATHPDREGAKMITGSGGELQIDLATAVYRAAWHALGLIPWAGKADTK